MIKLQEITKTFNAGQHNEVRPVRGISLQIDQGGLTVFKGASGSGKTTLLGMIGAMSRPTSGRIWLHEDEITSFPEHFLTTLRRKHFGFIFQVFNLLPGLSALDNVMLPALPTGLRTGTMAVR